MLKRWPAVMYGALDAKTKMALPIAGDLAETAPTLLFLLFSRKDQAEDYLDWLNADWEILELRGPAQIARYVDLPPGWTRELVSNARVAVDLIHPNDPFVEDYSRQELLDALRRVSVSELN